MITEVSVSSLFSSHYDASFSDNDRNLLVVETRIVWATRKTSLGQLSMAMNERGVCYVELEDSIDGLSERLENEFHEASISAATQLELAMMTGWLEAIERSFTQGAPCPEIPLDVHGTPFQEKVWHYLKQVKSGDVVSYSDLAAAIGSPKAVRAVGSACGANRIAVLIPCHRAVRQDGTLGGYKWGLDRKKSLLMLERETRERTRALS